MSNVWPNHQTVSEDDDMTTGLLGMMASQKTAETIGKKKEGGVPKCSVCGTTMKPSIGSKGEPIWICPLGPEHPTKPRGG